MAAPIGPGDWVECVEVYCRFMAEVGFKLHGLYIVSGIGEWRSPRSDGTWLACEGVRSPCDFGAPMPGWDADLFRLIYRPRASFIASLKAPPNLSPREVEVA